MKIRLLFIALICILVSVANAQQAIIQIEDDDTLPIANTRFDDAVEPPKQNFTSASKNDPWEKFERGELDQKAFIRLQEDYQRQARHSKDPYMKNKRKRMMAAQKRRAKMAASKKSKETQSRKPASVKKAKPTSKVKPKPKPKRRPRK